MKKKNILNKKDHNKNKPKISIYLPIYNKEKYLKRSIGSIQKQTLKDLEIIAVNDYSTDNSLKILQDLAQEDSRIKIINNPNNRGLLYSRAIGILNSKGEYLINLDPDDEFNGINDLKYLYNKAKRYNVDYISYVILYLPDNLRMPVFQSFNKVINQPKLFESAFKGNVLIDYYITNKMIKKELLKYVYKIFENKINGNKWNYHEDNIWSILIHKYANSAINVNKEVYYYYNNNDSEMNNKGNFLEMQNLLYRYDICKEIFKYNHDLKYFFGMYMDILKKYDENINVIKQNNYLKNHFFNITKDILTNYNASDKIRNLTNIAIKNIYK